MAHTTSPVKTGRPLTRRQFLQGVAGLGLSAAGLALLDACGSKPATGEEPLETTTIRLTQSLPSVCLVPQYLAEELLQREGFTNIQ